MREKICPNFDACLISSMLKVIEVPHVLEYCYRNFNSCRYFLPTARQDVASSRVEEANV